MVYVDQSGHGHLRVTGDDRVRFLHSVCTANVEALAEGHGTHAAMLTPKGRVVSIFEIHRQADAIVLQCEAHLLEPLHALLDKYAMMDDVAFERVELAVHRCWTDTESAWSAPMVFAAPPAPAATAAEVECLRIEAGLVRYGVDVTEDNFPFETPLSRYLDYQKGCYIGQEPVFRVHSMGNANKTLRGLRISGDGAVSVGAELSHADRPQAGKVTSAVVSPRYGSIALAYLHRNVWSPGETVTVQGRDATVIELPFAPPS